MKKIKNVDVAQCVGILIFSLVTMCTVLIPFKFEGPDFAFNHLPIIGDESFITMLSDYLKALFDMINVQAPEIVLTISDYTIYAFYGILAFDFLASLILIIFRSKVVRIIAKVISIIAGIVMIALCLVYFIYIFAFIFYIASIVSPGVNTFIEVQKGGLIFIFAIFLISFLLISRQFKWFRRYY